MLAGIATVAALGTATAACAGRPPSDSSPMGGGPPPGVVAAPARPDVGPATNPMPPQPDMTPPADRQPLGSVDAAGGRVGLRPVNRDALADSVSVRLDSVLAVAASPQPHLPLPAALGLIDFFRRYYGGQNDQGMRSVAMELDSLRAQLTASPVDQRATARVLRRLGRRTAGIAPRSGVYAGRIARLSDLLQDQAARLTPNTQR
jgi:hypothetical protein